MKLSTIQECSVLRIAASTVGSVIAPHFLGSVVDVWLVELQVSLVF